MASANFEMKLRMKRFFFDRPHVIRRIGKGNAIALSNVGAKLRTAIARSMRRRKSPSAPGEIPHRHVGTHEGVGDIQFFFDERRMSLAVGPVKFSRTKRVPNFLEFGSPPQVIRVFAYTATGKKIAADGTVAVKRRGPRGGRMRSTGKRRKAVVRKFIHHPAAPPKTITVARRPFMNPGLKKAIAKGEIKESWKGVVTDG